MRLPALWLLAAALSFPIAAWPQERHARPGSPDPLHSSLFEENRGQFGPEIRFVARGPHCSLAVSSTALRFRWADAHGTFHTASLSLSGGALVAPRGEDLAPGKVSYFLGDDPNRWRTQIPTFQRVRWAAVYPGVDLILRGGPADFEFDFAIAPGASAWPITLTWSGERPSLHHGKLRLHDGDAFIDLLSPRAYERLPDGRQRLLASAFRMDPQGAIRFSVPRRDPALPLLIDPVIVSSTYLGGESPTLHAVAVDGAGDVYLAGETPTSDNYWITTGVGPAGGTFDAFITELDPSGERILFSSYFGGNGDDSIDRIALSTQGDSVFAGSTTSTDLAPSTQVAQFVLGGGQDAFIGRMRTADEVVILRTYLGGSGDEEVRGLAVDAVGNIYVAGVTTSTNFPLVTPLQSTLRGPQDGWLTKLPSQGNAFTFSTYLGGSGTDELDDLVVDASGSLYAVGSTDSTDFPTVSAFQNANRGSQDAILVKLPSTGAFLAYATYFGGSGTDQFLSLVVGAQGDVWTAGWTGGADFPTAQSLQPFVGPASMTLTHFGPSGAMDRSTFLGAGTATQLELDGSDGLYLGGTTFSTVPQINPLQSGSAGSSDAVLIHLASDQTVDFSTNLGGSNGENVTGLAAARQGRVFVGGTTSSMDFPVARAINGNRTQNGTTSFLTTVDLDPALITSVSPTFGPEGGGTEVTLTGKDFRNDDLVTFDGLAATQVVWLSNGSLRATTPAHGRGKVSVAVLRGAAATSLPGAFSYTGPQERLGVSCQSAPGFRGAGTPWALVGLAAWLSARGKRSKRRV